MGMMSSIATSRKALYAGAIAASMFVAAGAGMTHPAYAQEPVKVAANVPEVTTTTDCSKWQPSKFMSDSECEILKSEALDAERQRLEAQGQALDAQLTCIKKVKAAFDRGEVAREKVREYGKERICELAATLG